jgi:hypothetical protein
MSTKSYPSRLVFFVNILAIVPLGYIVRFSHILPEYIHDVGRGIASEIFLILLWLWIQPLARSIRAEEIAQLLALTLYTFRSFLKRMSEQIHKHRHIDCKHPNFNYRGFLHDFVDLHWNCQPHNPCHQNSCPGFLMP